MDKKVNFCTVINCMDGRIQETVNKFLRKKLKKKYVDTITEPGPVKILSERKDELKLNSILERCDISIKNHGSKSIAVAGHFDCAVNKVNKETHISQIKESCKFIMEKYPDISVTGLYVNKKWEVKKIC